MRRSWLRGVGLLVLAAGIAAGCSSSDDNTGSATDGTVAEGSGSGGAVRGVTDDTITIGGIAQLASYAGVEEGARARFERANRDGGIAGRQIEYVGVKDDGVDAGRDLDVARELVEADGVFAIAPVASQVFLPQSSDLLADNEVPFVGWGFMPGFCGNDFGYGFNGCLVGEDYVNSGLVDPVLNAMVDEGTAMEDIRVAIQSGDDITGRSGAAQYASTIEKRGATVVYNEQNLPSDTQTTDFSPFARAVADSNPNLVYTSARFADLIGLTTAIRQAGFEGPVVNFVTYVPGLLDAQPEVAKALEGVWVSSQVPPSESGSPAVEQLAEDLEAIDEEPFVTLGASVGYWSADLLVQQLEAAGENLTPETFQAAMEDFTYEPLDGGIGPVSFPRDKTQATPCSAVVGIKAGAYEEIEPMDCYESYKKEA